MFVFGGTFQTHTKLERATTPAVVVSNTLPYQRDTKNIRVTVHRKHNAKPRHESGLHAGAVSV